MVVALHLERDRLAFSEVDDSRVLARSLEDARAFGGKAAEQQRRVFVAAVLRPEEGKNSELELSR
jgi:hypothetical protein